MAEKPDRQIQVLKFPRSIRALATARQCSDDRIAVRNLPDLITAKTIGRSRRDPDIANKPKLRPRHKVTTLEKPLSPDNNLGLRSILREAHNSREFVRVYKY